MTHKAYMRRVTAYRALLRGRLESEGRVRKSSAIKQLAQMMDLSHPTSWRLMSVICEESWIMQRSQVLQLAPEAAEQLRDLSTPSKPRL